MREGVQFHYFACGVHKLTINILNYLVIFLRTYTLSFQPHAEMQVTTSNSDSVQRSVDFLKGRLSENLWMDLLSGNGHCGR